MKILMVRGNKVDPDPRVEKEVNSLIKEHRHEVTILAWDRTEEYDIHDEILSLPDGNARIVRMGIPATWGGGMRKNAKAAIKFQLRATKWIKKNIAEFDAIHATSFTIGNAVIKYKKRGIRLVYDIYDYYADIHKTNKLLHNLISFSENNVINRADATIICSEERKEQIKGSRPRKLYIIHNSPSQNMMRENLNNKRICKSCTDLPKIVYVGNLIPDRYIDHVIEIAALDKNFEVHIGGFGILESKVIEYSKKYSNIFYYGRMQYSDVLKLETECDILLALYDPNVPNHKFAAPNKFYESLFLGKPVIMFRNTGMDKIVENERIGAVAEYSDESLLSSINSIIERKDEWGVIAEKSKQLFHDFYSWEIMEARLLKLYEELN